MAVSLENIPATAILARTAIFCLYRTAQMAASIPNRSYHMKAFPETLFHQLLLVMTHPDHETRFGAHRILSAILIPSVVCPCLVSFIPVLVKEDDPQGTYLIGVQGFFASRDILEKEGKKYCIIQNLSLESSKKLDAGVEVIGGKECHHVDAHVQRSTVNQCSGESHNIKLSPLCTVPDGKELTSLRLSSRQVGLLLSSIWAQATSQENTPANYGAIMHSYNLALLFSQTKTSSQLALVRCFQLALSLRRISLDLESCLQPSCKRSLFTLASSMLIFSAKAGELPHLITSLKTLMIEKKVDPHLHLMEDGSLKAFYVASSNGEAVYGSEEDDISTLKFFQAMKRDDEQIQETVITNIMKKFENLREEELLSIKKQLSQEFLPDDACPLGAPLFTETSSPSSPPTHNENHSFDEITHPTFLEDGDSFPEASGNQSDINIQYMDALDIPSANQLIESVLETARQAACLSGLTTPVSYDQMKSQCETLGMGKQQVSSLLSFKQSQNKSPKVEYASVALQEAEKVFERSNQCIDSLPSKSEQSLRLPSSSPYDKFLKAAGC